MPFSAITSGEIQAGKPVATSTQNKIKENFDDHETRIQSLEGASSVFPPIIFRVNGRQMVLENVVKTTTNFSFTITGVRILVDKAGSAGTLEIDIQRKRGGGAWTTIFTAKPSIAFGAGDDALSAAGTLDAGMVDAEAGDIFRLDITSVQTGGKNFLVRVDYNRG